MLVTYTCRCGCSHHTDTDDPGNRPCGKCGRPLAEAEKVVETPQQEQLSLFDEPPADTARKHVLPSVPKMRRFSKETVQRAAREADYSGVSGESEPHQVSAPGDKKQAALEKIEKIVTKGSKDFVKENAHG